MLEPSRPFFKNGDATACPQGFGRSRSGVWPEQWGFQSSPHPWVVLADSKGLKSPVLPGRDKGLPTGGRRPSSLPPKPLFLYAVEIKQPKGFLMPPSPNHPPPLPGRSASCQDTRTPAGRGGTSCFLCSVALFPARPRTCCNAGDGSFAGGFLTIVPPSDLATLMFNSFYGLWKYKIYS